MAEGGSAKSLKIHELLSGAPGRAYRPTCWFWLFYHWKNWLRNAKKLSRIEPALSWLLQVVLAQERYAVLIVWYLKNSGISWRVEQLVRKGAEGLRLGRVDAGLGFTIFIPSGDSLFLLFGTPIVQGNATVDYNIALLPRGFPGGWRSPPKTKRSDPYGCGSKPNGYLFSGVPYHLFKRLLRVTGGTGFWPIAISATQLLIQRGSWKKSSLSSICWWGLAHE